MAEWDREGARRSLDGVWVGDALGQALRGPTRLEEVPEGRWRFSDDTVQAEALVEVVEEYGRVDPDVLAREFAARYRADPERGYGAVAFWMLHQIAEGARWREVSAEVFGGTGSKGNGAAMRVAPLGAGFAGDMERVVAEAEAQAQVTHAHPEGRAGAVAVAVAAASRARGEPVWEQVLRWTPAGEVRARLEVAATWEGTPEEAGARLGTGVEILAEDTVPYSVWCVAQGGTFEGVVRRAVWGLEVESDRDTVLAIVGGIAAASEETPAPEGWKARCEGRRGGGEIPVRDGPRS